MSVSEQEIEQAVAHVCDMIKDYDNLDPSTQKILDAGIVAIRAKLDKLKADAALRKQELDQARQAQKRISAQSRKEYRDQVIPEWCRENLRPGMVVKVKANSATTLRQVIEVGPASRWSAGSFRGHHCHYTRVRDGDRIVTKLVLDGYITDHLLTNVQGVVFSTDPRGRAVVTPIMDLIAGERQPASQDDQPA